MVDLFRKQNRMKGFNYSSPGYYFVTICVNKRQCIFGNIQNQKMILNQFGKIVHEKWNWLQIHYDDLIDIDEFIIMPNHFHGIIIIKNLSNPVVTGLDLSLQKNQLSLSNIIGAFKTTSSMQIHRIGLKTFQWQRSFYDQIIRTEYSLYAIRRYIKNNPKNWETDRNNLINKSSSNSL